jgi:hypothetical protein
VVILHSILNQSGLLLLMQTLRANDGTAKADDAAINDQ